MQTESEVIYGALIKTNDELKTAVPDQRAGSRETAVTVNGDRP